LTFPPLVLLAFQSILMSSLAASWKQSHSQQQMAWFFSLVLKDSIVQVQVQYYLYKYKYSYLYDTTCTDSTTCTYTVLLDPTYLSLALFV
jgi:hypothetical protein